MHALIRQRSLRRALACALLLILLPVMSLGDVGVVNCKSLNLRSQASKKSKALQTLDLGTALNIVGSEGGWYKVVYGEFTGYVMKEYVNVAASSPPAPAARRRPPCPTTPWPPSASRRPASRATRAPT